MTFTLSPETEERILSRVRSGEYPNAEDVVAEALALLANKERYEANFEKLKAAIAVGSEEYERGEGFEFSSDFLANAVERAKERSRQGMPIADDVKP